MPNQCLHTEALGGMMTGCNVRHTRFSRQMDVLLGDFAGDKGINTERC